MQDFEKLGVFYLGRKYDLARQSGLDELVLYDSKDLVTHAVCVGMTGSGKTGLCIGLLEEAAIDSIPAIVIDPKGDLANLLLAFPDLLPQDFAPWINADDARRAGVAPEVFAAQQAELWKSGLAKWGQDGARIRRLADSADFTIYTPGSNAGTPISILRSFSAPGAAVIEDGEMFQELISTTTTSLLGLLGIDADPIQSREHILISTVFNAAWRASRDLDLAGLIQEIQKPPVQRVGVIDLESFFPAKERFALSMRLNNLLASPAFASWRDGEPLDVNAALYTLSGKPRVSIFSIAHLSDAERMFFVSLLLNQTLGWMRSQSGTTSLRAVLYMDEIFGYFPPVANPPSKAPLLTLLKQARAFGLGVVLATQNPVDLDYKGLSNCGTWFIGRLQTERDKLRVLDGLEGAATQGSGARDREGAGFDRSRMEKLLSSLGKRVFLMNNVHESAPEVFETRWTLSYLRGPLARQEIKKLMDAKRARTRPEEPVEAVVACDERAVAVPAGNAGGAAPAKAIPIVSSGASSTVPSSAVPSARPSSTAFSGASPSSASDSPSARPVLPPEIAQYFVPLRAGSRPLAPIAYRPALFGAARVYFSDSKSGVDCEMSRAVVVEFQSGAMVLDWDRATSVPFSESELSTEPAGEATFAAPPAEAAKPKSYDSWKRSLADLMYRTQKLELWKSANLGAISKPGESERDFRLRLQQAAREQRDAAKEKLRAKYAPKTAAIQERIRRAEQAVQREAEQARGSKLATGLSFATTLLGAFTGRKTLSATNVSRASSTMRGVGRSMKAGKDVERAQETLATLAAQMSALDAQFQGEVRELELHLDPLTEPLDTLAIKPKKANITVKVIALAWVPYWQSSDGRSLPAWS